MTDGCIDLFTSRRVSYNRCYYYSQIRTEGIVERSEIVYKEKPTGSFCVREETDEVDSVNEVVGSFRFDRKTITLKTYEDATKLQRDELVLYQGRIWLVSSVRRKKKAEAARKRMYK